MTFTIEFGWWIAPALITLLSFGFAVGNFSTARGDYSFPEVWNGILLLLATIPSLVAWLIWALAA